MIESKFNWDDDYHDMYYTEKYAHRNMGGMSVDNQREELMRIIHQIRADLQCKRINVFVSKDLQIVLSTLFDKVETMLTIMDVFEEINRLERAYLSDFDISNFEMVMEGEKPTIYCSYERI